MQAVTSNPPKPRIKTEVLRVRYLKGITDALATLSRLEAEHPGYSRLIQERGHYQVAAGGEKSPRRYASLSHGKGFFHR
jgi:hypothetical protein